MHQEREEGQREERDGEGKENRSSLRDKSAILKSLHRHEMMMSMMVASCGWCGLVGMVWLMWCG